MVRALAAEGQDLHALVKALEQPVAVVTTASGMSQDEFIRRAMGGFESKLSSATIDVMIHVVERHADSLNDWTRGFLRTIKASRARGVPLTSSQKDKLSAIHRSVA
jgi:hypothetical protein